MRFARGGKTVTLSKIFDMLKENPTVHPILISLNGAGPNAFKRRCGETNSQAILRLIAVQLGDFSPVQALNLIVEDRTTLDQHLGENVVLLLDELNNFDLPLDSDTAEMLREMFLDKAGRFLVFTCHFPVSIETDQIRASDILGKKVPPSLRGISTVNMSQASAVSELRGMSVACEALTEQKAAWLAYIPSLIYCTMNNGVMTPSNRFKQMQIIVEPGDQLNILKRFVGELLTGQRDPQVAHYYGAFASVGANALVSYPLCYVKQIFKQLRIHEAVVHLLLILSKLGNHLHSTNNGLAWECTVEVAIILRMMEAQWNDSMGPFNLFLSGTKPNLAFRTLPDECSTLKMARGVIDGMITGYKSPTLIYVGSANACFPEVEGFVAYTSGCLETSKIVGFQMKTADVKPRNCINLNIINCGAVLIRGRALAKTPRPPRDGWKYMTSNEVREFLGNSLLLAMPRGWLRDP
jgi:hypothetical protein